MTVWRALNVVVLALVAALQLIQAQGAEYGIPRIWLFVSAVLTVFLTVLANQMPALLRDDTVEKSPSPLITPEKPAQ